MPRSYVASESSLNQNDSLLSNDHLTRLDLDDELIPEVVSSNVAPALTILIVASLVTVVNLLLLPPNRFFFAWFGIATIASLTLYLACLKGRPALLSTLISVTITAVTSALWLTQILPLTFLTLAVSSLVIMCSQVFTNGASRRSYLWNNRERLLHQGIMKTQRELEKLSDTTRGSATYVLALLTRIEKERLATNVHELAGIELTAYISDQRQRLQKTIGAMEELQTNLDHADLLVARVTAWQAQLFHFCNSEKPKAKNDSLESKLQRLSYDEWPAWQESVPALWARVSELTNSLPALPMNEEEPDFASDPLIRPARLTQTGHDA